jgi:inner membrane protein
VDTLTHALTGAVISNLGFKQRLPAATFTLVTASVLPDLDWASRFFGIASYLKYHRTFTHSLLGIVILAILLAVVVKIFFRRANLKTTFLLSLFAGLFHLLLDLLNPYGTQILYPFLPDRYAWNWLTVVDPLITIPLTLSLVLIRFVRLKAVRTAAITLGFVILFIFTKGICHQIALKQLDRMYPSEQHPVKTVVYPDIFSPFVWKGVLETEESYRITVVNITSAEATTVRDYPKLPESRFAGLARESSLVQAYLRLARHPLLYCQEVDGYHFVSWQDLAYGLRGRRGMVVEVVLNDRGEILHQRFSFVDPRLHPERVKRLVEKVTEGASDSKKKGGD